MSFKIKSVYSKNGSLKKPIAPVIPSKVEEIIEKDEKDIINFFSNMNMNDNLKNKIVISQPKNGINGGMAIRSTQNSGPDYM